MITPVLYTAQKGKDVFTDDVRFRTIDSTRNQFKVGWSGVEIFSLNSGNSYSWIKTITHNLGYAPQALAWGYSILDAGSGTAGVDARYSILPFNDYVLAAPSNKLFVATIEKTTTYVKFKFYEDTTTIYGADPQPAFYTLTNMKMKYLVFIDQD